MALVAFASGCFLQHGRGGDDAAAPDAGIDAPTDSAMCNEAVGEVSSLSCPSSAAPGSIVRVGYTHTHPGCCSEGVSRVGVSRSGTTWTLDGEWTVCDCCEGCRCLGPIEEGTIEIGPLEPGVHRVVGDGSECTIVVDATRSECAPFTPSDVRASRVLFEGQQLAFSMMQEENLGCGCQPRLTRALDDAFVAELCDCCEECFCIDAPYAVSYMGAAVHVPPAMINDYLLPTEHRSLESCRPVEATGLRIVEPEEPVTRDGPAIWWAVVSGMETVCCVEPFGGVNELILGAVGRHLELRSCVDFDCDCLGRPAPFEAWYPLGEYPPGSGELIRAGSHEVLFRAE